MLVAGGASERLLDFPWMALELMTMMIVDCYNKR